MTKKLVTLKVEEADIAAMDTKAKAWNLSRAAMILLAVRTLPAEPFEKLQPRRANPTGKPRDIRAKHDAMQAKFPKIIAELARRESPADEFGAVPPSVDISKIDIADYGFRRPVSQKTPKKGK